MGPLFFFMPESGAIGEDYFVVENLAVEIGEEGGCFVGDYGVAEVVTGETADGVEGAPVGFDEDFGFIFVVAEGDGGSEIAGNLAKLWENRFRKVVEVFGQILVAGARGPAAEDGSGGGGLGGFRGLGSSGRVVADDYVPGADFPFLGETVEDVGIFFGEGFDFGFVVHVKDEEGAVYGFA